MLRRRHSLQVNMQGTYKGDEGDTVHGRNSRHWTLGVRFDFNNTCASSTHQIHDTVHGRKSRHPRFGVPFHFNNS